MSKHWRPDNNAVRGRFGDGLPQRIPPKRWLSPDEYRTLTPQEKRELSVYRREWRRAHAFGENLMALVTATVFVAAAWVQAFGFPAPVQRMIHPRSPPVSAIFGSCKWGGGTNCVVDGDTFWIAGQKVRIADIDAPETHDYRCASELALGDRATAQLKALLNSGAVTMTSIDRDRDVYGRLLRNVSVNGRDVGEELISAGVARAYAGGRRPWC
jgi:micrococcal nuclease